MYYELYKGLPKQEWYLNVGTSTIEGVEPTIESILEELKRERIVFDKVSQLGESIIISCTGDTAIKILSLGSFQRGSYILRPNNRISFYNPYSNPY